MQEVQPNDNKEAHQPELVGLQRHPTITKADEQLRQDTELQLHHQGAKQIMSQAQALAIIQQAQSGKGGRLDIEALEAALTGTKQQSSPAVRITQAIISLLFGLVFGILFLVYTCTSDLHGSNCGDLKEYCYDNGIIIVLGTGITFFLQLDMSNQNWVASVRQVIGISFGITSLVLWILIWVALAQDESCGDLRTLALVYNWMVVGSIGLGCCCSIVMLVFGASQL